MSDVADALRVRVHREWQQRVGAAFRDRGWHPPRYKPSGGPVPWEEVAALAVETLWNDLERIVVPVIELLDAEAVGQAAGSPTPSRAPTSRRGKQAPWLSADDVAPLLQTTAHSLRRLAREGRSPVLVRRIGGRWWFARRDVYRFIGASPADDDNQE
jgi:hypothetical protein